MDLKRRTSSKNLRRTSSKNLRRTSSKSVKRNQSKQSNRKTIKFSLRGSSASDIPDDAISEEIDIDERVIRSTTRHHDKLDQPCTISIENSRIFDLLQNHFPHELPQDNEWPDFEIMTPGECVNILGQILGCENHEENLASFWMLDTLCEILRQGQLKGVTNENLNATCLWFVHFLKTISVYAPTREEFFCWANEMLFEVESEYVETGKLTKPKELLEILEIKKKEINYVMKSGALSLQELLPEANDIVIESESNENVSEEQSQSEEIGSGDASMNTLDTEPSEDCTKLNELAFLAEQIFRVFGNRFKYEVIKTVFSDPPEIKPIVIVEKMNFPKELGQSQKQIQELNTKRREPSPVKTKSKKETPKKSADKASKKKKKTVELVKKVEKVELVNVALERFKTELQHIDWEREYELEKERTKDFYIKALEDSVDKEFFERLFPKIKEPDSPQLQKTKEKPGTKGKEKPGSKGKEKPGSKGKQKKKT